MSTKSTMVVRLSATMEFSEEFSVFDDRKENHRAEEYDYCCGIRFGDELKFVFESPGHYDVSLRGQRNTLSTLQASHGYVVRFTVNVTMDDGSSISPAIVQRLNNFSSVKCFIDSKFSFLCGIRKFYEVKLLSLMFIANKLDDKEFCRIATKSHILDEFNSQMHIVLRRQRLDMMKRDLERDALRDKSDMSLMHQRYRKGNIEMISSDVGLMNEYRQMICRGVRIELESDIPTICSDTNLVVFVTGRTLIMAELLAHSIKPESMISIPFEIDVCNDIGVFNWTDGKFVGKESSDCDTVGLATLCITGHILAWLPQLTDALSPYLEQLNESVLQCIRYVVRRDSGAMEIPFRHENMVSHWIHCNVKDYPHNENGDVIMDTEFTTHQDIFERMCRTLGIDLFHDVSDSPCSTLVLRGSMENKIFVKFDNNGKFIKLWTEHGIGKLPLPMI